jgi:hypothetical protein
LLSTLEALMQAIYLGCEGQPLDLRETQAARLAALRQAIWPWTYLHAAITERRAGRLLLPLPAMEV